MEEEASRAERAGAGAASLDKPRPKRWIPAVIIGLALAVGLGGRGWLVSIAPTSGFFGDHDDLVRWGILASERGLTPLYREPPPRWRALVPGPGGELQFHERPVDRVLNYPPLAAYLIATEGQAHKRIDGDRIVNTPTSRLVYSVLSILADVVIALGCLAMTRLFAGPVAGAIAFGVAFLAPPIAINGSHFGQIEAWVLAPAIWMVWAMMKRRWLLAGLLFGVALGMKPQALLLAPLWLFAFLVGPRRGRVVSGLGVALVVLNLAALPFWLASGADWFRRSYLETLVEASPHTTSRAFNLWYVDLLLSGVQDARAPLLGAPRQLLGLLLLSAALVGGYALAYRRWAPDRATLLLLAAFTLLAAVMLPTRVHDRYVLMAVPFLVGAAMRVPVAWPGVIAILIVATFQHTIMNWHTLLAEQGTSEEARARAEAQIARRVPDRAQRAILVDRAVEEFERRRDIDRPKEWGLTILALAGTAWVLFAVSRFRGAEPRDVARAVRPLELDASATRRECAPRDPTGRSARDDHQA